MIARSCLFLCLWIAGANAIICASTVAGAGTWRRGIFDGNGKRGNATLLHTPASLAIDAAGNVFIADRGHHLVRKLSVAGIVTTVAGNGQQDPFATDWSQPVRGTAVPVQAPAAIAISSLGELVVAPTLSSWCTNIIPSVWAVNGSGWVQPLVAGLQYAAAQDGGIALDSCFSAPVQSMTRNVSSGAILIAVGREIWRINADGTLWRVAGGGWLQEGPARDCFIGETLHLGWGRAGTLLLSMGNMHQVVTIDSSGELRLFAGTGNPGYEGDGGAANVAMLNQPAGIGVTPAGHVVFAEVRNGVVRSVHGGTSVISTIAGAFHTDLDPLWMPPGQSVPAGQLWLQEPTGIAVTTAGAVLVSEAAGGWVWSVNTATSVATVIVGRTSGYGATAPDMSWSLPPGQPLNDPREAFLTDVNVAVAATPGSCRVSSIQAGILNFWQGAACDTRIDLSHLQGVSSSVVPLRSLTSMALDRAGGFSVFADGYLLRWSNWTDGLMYYQSFPTPVEAVIVRAPGQWLVSQPSSGVVLQVNASSPGVSVGVFVGNGTVADGGDGLPALQTSLVEPAGMALTPDGDVLIVDRGACKVRRMFASNGTVSTVAGTGVCALGGSAQAAVRTPLQRPYGVTMWGRHGIVVSEEHRIRLIDPTGRITTVMGSANGDAGWSNDTLGASSALHSPALLTNSWQDALIVTDRGNNRVKTLWESRYTTCLPTILHVTANFSNRLCNVACPYFVLIPASILPKLDHIFDSSTGYFMGTWQGPSGGEDDGNATHAKYWVEFIRGQFVAMFTWWANDALVQLPLNITPPAWPALTVTPNWIGINETITFIFAAEPGLQDVSAVTITTGGSYARTMIQCAIVSRTATELVVLPEFPLYPNSQLTFDFKLPVYSTSQYYGDMIAEPRPEFGVHMRLFLPSGQLLDLTVATTIVVSVDWLPPCANTSEQSPVLYTRFRSWPCTTTNATHLACQVLPLSWDRWLPATRAMLQVCTGCVYFSSPPLTPHDDYENQQFTLAAGNQYLWWQPWANITMPDQPPTGVQVPGVARWLNVTYSWPVTTFLTPFARVITGARVGGRECAQVEVLLSWSVITCLWTLDEASDEWFNSSSSRAIVALPFFLRIFDTWSPAPISRIQLQQAPRITSVEPALVHVGSTLLLRGDRFISGDSITITVGGWPCGGAVVLSTFTATCTLSAVTHNQLLASPGYPVLAVVAASLLGGLSTVNASVVAGMDVSPRVLGWNSTVEFVLAAIPAVPFAPRWVNFSSPDGSQQVPCDILSSNVSGLVCRVRYPLDADLVACRIRMAFPSLPALAFSPAMANVSFTRPRIMLLDPDRLLSSTSTTPLALRLDQPAPVCMGSAATTLKLNSATSGACTFPNASTALCTATSGSALVVRATLIMCGGAFSASTDLATAAAPVPTTSAFDRALYLSYHPFTLFNAASTGPRNVLSPPANNITFPVTRLGELLPLLERIRIGGQLCDLVVTLPDNITCRGWQYRDDAGDVGTGQAQTSLALEIAWRGTVFTAAGVATIAHPPQLTAVVPPGGKASGSIAVAGKYLLSPTATVVTVGGLPCAVVVTTDRLVQCVLPPGITPALPGFPRLAVTASTGYGPATQSSSYAIASALALRLRQGPPAVVSTSDGAALAREAVQVVAQLVIDEAGDPDAVDFVAGVQCSLSVDASSPTTVQLLGEDGSLGSATAPVRPPEGSTIVSFSPQRVRAPVLLPSRPQQVVVLSVSCTDSLGTTVQPLKMNFTMQQLGFKVCAMPSAVSLASQTAIAPISIALSDGSAGDAACTTGLSAGAQALLAPATCTAVLNTSAADVSGYIVNGVVTATANGRAVIGNAILAAPPGLNYSISVVCQIGSLPIPAWDAVPGHTPAMKVSVRGCAPGFQPVSSSCQKCGASEYSFGSACTSCPPRGVSCIGGELTLLPHFYRPAFSSWDGTFNASLELHPCWNTEACLVTAPPSATSYSCAPGYTGVLCGVCTDGFMPAGAACRACPPLIWVKVALGVVCAAAGAILIYIALRKGSKARSQSAIALRILLAYVQVLGTLKAFLAGGTRAYRDIMGWTDAVSASPLGGGLLHCLWRPPYVLQLTSVLLLPLLVSLAVVVVFLAATLVRSCRSVRSAVSRHSRGVGEAVFVADPASGDLRRRCRRWCRAPRCTFDRTHFVSQVHTWWQEHRHVSTLVFISTLCYMAVTSGAVKALDCIPPVAGARYLRADLSVECGVGEHALAQGLAITSLALFSGGFPLFVLWLLAFAPSRKLEDPSFQQAWGFLYDGYRGGVAVHTIRVDSGGAAARPARSSFLAGLSRARFSLVGTPARREEPAATAQTARTTVNPLAAARLSAGKDDDVAPPETIERPEELDVTELQCCQRDRTWAVWRRVWGSRMVWWEAVVLLRRAAVALIATTLTDPQIQTACGALLLLAATTAHSWAHPYAKPQFNRLEALCLFSLTATAILSVPLLRGTVLEQTATFSQQPPLSAAEWAVTVCAAALNLGTVAVAVGMFVWYRVREARAVAASSATIKRMGSRLRLWVSRKQQAGHAAQQLHVSELSTIEAGETEAPVVASRLTSAAPPHAAKAAVRALAPPVFAVNATVVPTPRTPTPAAGSAAVLTNPLSRARAQGSHPLSTRPALVRDGTGVSERRHWVSPLRVAAAAHGLVPEGASSSLVQHAESDAKTEAAVSTPLRAASPLPGPGSVTV